MKTGVKLIWSIVVLVAGFILAALCQSGIQGVSMIPGLIFIGTICAIVAIWRKKKVEEVNTNTELEEKELKENTKKHEEKINLLTDFQQRFNTEQKTVIARLLFHIAEADGDTNEKEWQQLNQAFSIIGYNPLDKEMQEISLKIAGHSLANLINVLDTLDKSDKEWFAITVYSLIMCDSDATEAEINQALYIITKIGISEDEFYNIVETAMTIYNKFKSKI